MTLKQKKRALYIFTALYAISFLLPAVQSIHDTLFGIQCAVWVVFGLIIDLDGGSFQTIALDIFLILPNFMMLFSFFFRKKIPPIVKYAFAIVVFTSTGYWSATRFGARLQINSDLTIGYWLWFISSTSYMVLSAMITEPKRKKPNRQTD